MGAGVIGEGDAAAGSAIVDAEAITLVKAWIEGPWRTDRCPDCVAAELDTADAV